MERAPRSVGPSDLAAGLITTFIAGVVAGSILGHFATEKRRAVLLLLIALLLAFAAVADQSRQSLLTICLLAFAMGVANSVLEHDGRTSVGVTYMTGSLVRIGHRLAGYAIGQRRTGWAPYALLWISLTAGAVAGALAYSLLQPAALGLASAVAGLLSVFAWKWNDNGYLRP